MTIRGIEPDKIMDITGVKEWHKEKTGRFTDSSCISSDLSDLSNLSDDMEWHLTTLHIPDLWFMGSGQGVRIAVIDSGIDYNNMEFQTCLVRDKWYNFGDSNTDPMDLLGHGTQMTSIIAAAPDGSGITGIAPDSEILALKINEGGKATFSETALAEAIVYAADNGADIINLSLTLPFSSMVADALDYAKDKDITIIAASGNNAKNTVSFPASYSGVTAISATDQNNTLWPRSNTGTEVSMSAPGVAIYCIYLDGVIMPASGTSVSSAVTSGIMAMTMSWGDFPIMETATSTALDAGAPGRDNEYGNGIITPTAILNAAFESSDASVNPPLCKSIGEWNDSLHPPVHTGYDDLSVEFHFTRPVNIIAGIMSDELKVAWIDKNCVATAAFQLIGNTTDIECQTAVNTLPFTPAYTFWLESEESPANLDWENSAYHLFYQPVTVTH